MGVDRRAFTLVSRIHVLHGFVWARSLKQRVKNFCTRNHKLDENKFCRLLMVLGFVLAGIAGCFPEVDFADWSI